MAKQAFNAFVRQLGFRRMAEQTLALFFAAYAALFGKCACCCVIARRRRS